MDIRPHILIVEDDLIAQIVIKNIFSKFDSDLDIVETAEKGLEKFKTTRYDLCFIDIGLPGEMDGIAMIESIRNSASGSRLPLIALTAHVQEAELEQLQKANVNRVVIKPLKWATLLEIMKEFLPQSVGFKENNG